MSLPTPRKPFTYVTFEGLDPKPLVQEGRDDDLYTAWCWALHIRVPDEYGTSENAARHFHQEILLTTALAHSWMAPGPEHTFPAAVGGDSFAGWCEPFGYGGEDDARALHLYFGAPDLRTARLMTVGFLALTGLTQHEVALSTGLDWAVQASIPETP